MSSTTIADYERKSYTWSETFWAGLYDYDRVGPHQTGHRGFAAVSTSVFTACEPRQ